MGFITSLKNLVLVQEYFPPRRGWNKEYAREVSAVREVRIEEVEQSSIKNEKVGEIAVHEDLLDDDRSGVPFIDLTQNLKPKDIEYRKTRRFKLKKFFWDGAGKHPLEQRYLLKLDFFLLTSACLGYFIKNLNQNNIATAYVNGMDEFYKMNNNQYNYMTTLFTVGYIIGQIPSNFVLRHISPRIYLGSLEILWAALTLLMITCGKDNIRGVYALRFFLGFLESGYLPGREWLLGSNYTTEEISKRSTYFAISFAISTIFSGQLQQAIIKRFGHSSLPPFKWLFVFDAVIGFPIGIYTLIVEPNTPSTTDAWYWNETDRLVGLERRRKLGAQLKTSTPYTWANIKTFFDTWHAYLFPLVFLTLQNAGAANTQPTFTTWMKITLKKPSSIYNTYPSIIAGCGIFLAITFAHLNDFLGGKKNFYFVALYFVMLIIGCASLAYWQIPIGWHWFSYFLNGMPPAWGQPFVASWSNRLLYENDMKRSFVAAVTSTLTYVTGAWVPIFVWNTKDKPKYFIGFTYTTCLSAVGLLLTCVTQYLAIRDEQRALLQQQEEDAAKSGSELNNEKSVSATSV